MYIVGMRNFHDDFKTPKRSFISAFSICMTVPLIQKIKSQYEVEQSICSVVKQWFYPLYTVRCHRLYCFGQVCDEQKNHLLKIELTGKYCLTWKYQHIALLTDSISNLLWMEFLFKWRIIILFGQLTPRFFKTSISPSQLLFGV